MKVPISISNRHTHLCKKDAEVLFGKSYKFKKLKELSQKGQFALEETVAIAGPKGKINQVRILGPRREKTQVEILRSDSFLLGVETPIKISGDLKGAASIRIIGPKENIKKKEAMIIAKRHLHISVEEAKAFNLTQGQAISIKTEGTRATTLHNVIVRIDPSFSLDCHIDQDEGNAAGLSRESTGTITQSQG